MKRLAIIAVTFAAVLGTSSASMADPNATVLGKIVSVDATDHLTLQAVDGTVVHVTLHRGTIILPTGLPLAPGMAASISGTNANGTLDANRISTPYRYAGVGRFFNDGSLAGPNAYVADLRNACISQNAPARAGCEGLLPNSAAFGTADATNNPGLSAVQASQKPGSH